MMLHKNKDLIKKNDLTVRFEASSSILVLYGASVVYFCNLYTTQPMLPLLAQTFRITPTMAGLSVSGVVLSIAIFSTLFGTLSDLWGRKRVMVWSAGLLVLPTFACAFAPNFGVLLAFRVLQGVFIPGLTAVAVAYLGELVSPASLGRVVGGWVAANVLGGLVGRVVSGILADHWGWQTPFWLFGCLTLMTTWIMYRVLPATPTKKSVRLWTAYRDMGQHLKDRQLLGAFLIGASLFFGFIGIYTYLPFYLMAAPFHLSPAVVAFAYVSYAAGVVASPLAGQLSTRYTRRTLIGLGLLIALGSIWLSLLPVLPWVMVSLFTLCTGMFSAQAVASALVNHLAKQGKGSAGALYLMFYYLGGTLGAVLPGLGWQAWGWYGVVGICSLAFGFAMFANGVLCKET